LKEIALLNLLDDELIWGFLTDWMNASQKLLPGVLALITSFVCIQGLDAQAIENGYGIIRGPDFAYSLKAPAGWVIDSKSGLGQGLPAVFYRKGGSWEESPVVAYARSRPRTQKVSTIEGAVKFLEETFHNEGFPKYQGEYIKTISTDSGKDAAIYHFTGDKWGDFEATAYFLEGKTINFVTLSARNEKDFQVALPAFEQLVTSYAFLPDKVPVNPKDRGFFQDSTPKN
jgi:hypothetical protein